MEAVEVEVRCRNCAVANTGGVWVVPNWDDVCKGGRAVFVAIEDDAEAVPLRIIADAVTTSARDWLAWQPAEVLGFHRLEVRGAGWRVLIEPNLTAELLETLLWRGLFHFIEYGFGETADWIVLTDPHEVLAS